MPIIPMYPGSKVGYHCDTILYPYGQVVYVPTGYLADVLEPRPPEMEIDETLFESRRIKVKNRKQRRSK